MTNKQQLRRITDPVTAATIMAMIDGILDPLEVSESARNYSRQCYHSPGQELLILYAADELLETCGVEGWPTGSDPRSGVNYCNTGHSYAATLALIVTGGSSTFTVTSYDVLARRHRQSPLQ
jgi:hypothetical protein